MNCERLRSTKVTRKLDLGAVILLYMQANDLGCQEANNEAMTSRSGS